MALTKTESNNLIKAKRKSNEDRGLVSIKTHFAFNFKFAIRDGILHWKRDKQGIVMNDLQMIPGYDVIRTVIKSSYVEEPSGVTVDTSANQPNVDIVTRLNSALNDVIQQEDKQMLKELSPYFSVKESKVDIYSQYLNNLILETASHSNIGKIVKNIKNLKKDVNNPDNDVKLNYYYLLCNVDMEKDTYNVLLICHNNKFYKIKYENVKDSDIDFSTADEAEREFNEIYSKASDKYFGNFNNFKIRVVNSNGQEGYRSLDQDWTGVDASEEEKVELNGDDFETDDIYEGKEPSKFESIYKIKKPCVLEITTDNLTFEKTYSLGDVLFNADLPNIKKHSLYKEDNIIVLSITGRDLAAGMIRQLEAKQTRVSINGKIIEKVRHANVMLRYLLPNIDFVFYIGNSFGRTKTRQRAIDSLSPWSKYNKDVKNRI